MTSFRFRVHRLIPSAASCLTAVDSQETPTSATLLHFASAAFFRPRGVAQYVYLDPALASSSSVDRTSAGSSNHGTESDGFATTAPSSSPVSNPQARRAVTAPPSCPRSRKRASVARAKVL